MPKHKHLKEKIRARSEKTGERYTTARAHLVGKSGSGTGSSDWNPTIVLHGPPRFGKLGFRIDDHWGWEWLDSAEDRKTVFERVLDRVQAEQPQVVTDVRLSLGLYDRAPEEVITEYFGDFSDDRPAGASPLFWMAVNLLAVEDTRVGVFLRALQHVGWDSDPNMSWEFWGYAKEKSRPAAEYLVDMMETWAGNGFFGEPNGGVPDHVGRAIESAVFLDEVACRASLAAADAELSSRGWDMEQVMPFDYRDKGTTRRGYHSTVVMGTRELDLVIGAHYLASTPAYGGRPPKRPCILLGLDHSGTPSAAWVRWMDTKRQGEVEISDLWPDAGKGSVAKEK